MPCSRQSLFWEVCGSLSCSVMERIRLGIGTYYDYNYNNFNNYKKKKPSFVP